METKAALCAAVLEVLDNNYEDWSVRVRTYLKAQDLWHIVVATTEPPTEEDDEATFKAWEKKDSMALHVIQISCGSDAFSKIRKSISAKDAWYTLRATYGPKTSDSGMDNYKSNDYGEYDDLSKALQSGELYAAREFFILRPNAVNEKITVLGQTALHIAVAARHLHIVNELIELMWDEALEIKDDQGNTALFEALFIGNCDMAKRMLNKNKNLVNIGNKSKILPVVMAIQFGYTELAEQLYSLTPLDLLTPEKGVNGATLCTQAIYTRNLDPFLFNAFCVCWLKTTDIALDLIEKCPRLALALDRENCSPLYALSAIPYAFPSGEPPVFWKRWIYSCTCIPLAGAANEIRLDSEKEEKRQNDQAKPIGLGTRIPSAGATKEVCLEFGKEEKRQNDQAKPIGSVMLALLRQLASNLHNFFGIEHLHKMESVHTRCHKLLLCMCKEISRSNMQERKKGCVDKAIFCAIKNGNFEFLFHIVKANSDLLRCSDRESRNIFLLAVLHRQAKIFSLLYGLEEKNVMIYDSDVYGNFILHMAGMSAASTLLNRISGPALEMQRELQWFKEVESIVHPKVTEAVNKDGLTPRELFTKNHKDMKQAGEQWMKGTATSCTVVAALIVTIMFAAAFTVPGGNDQNTGFPMFVHKRLFMAFIISDALSLFSSSTSVLMFLGILTSSYAEEDFLKSLPRKMIIGLFTLFFSITTMVIAFSTALLNMLPGKSWLVFSVICFALLPVATFLFVQISLLFVMCKSTFKPNIFHKKMKSWV